MTRVHYGIESLDAVIAGNFFVSIKLHKRFLSKTLLPGCVFIPPAFI